MLLEIAFNSWDYHWFDFKQNKTPFNYFNFCCFGIWFDCIFFKLSNREKAKEKKQKNAQAP